MANESYERTPAGFFSGFNQRLIGVERRLARIPTTTATRGTTTERDALYGVPTTDAARVSLANEHIEWFNTDFGWEESYYATTGLAGLTAQGLRAGIASGWYPVTTGPRAVVFASAGQAHTNGSIFSNWSFSRLDSYSRGGAAWFELYDSNKTLRAKKAGYYRVTGSMGFPSGTGTGVASWRGNIPSNAWVFPVPLLGGYGQIVQMSLESVLPVDGGVYFQTDAASWTVGNADNGNTYLGLEYLGPALVAG